MVELIEAGEFHVFPDALRFALALAFSAKNAGEFLKRIPLDVCTAERDLLYDFIHEGMTLLNLFGADISGRDFDHDRPTNDLSYSTAGAWLPDRELFVIEDAPSRV